MSNGSSATSKTSRLISNNHGLRPASAVTASAIGRRREIAIGEQVDDEHGREPEDRAERPRDRGARARDPEDRGEHVDVERALVVAERLDEEREACAVLVLAVLESV